MSWIGELLLCGFICVDTTLQGADIFLDVVPQNVFLPGPLVALPYA
jgi:hypothetical protein